MPSMALPPQHGRVPIPTRPGGEISAGDGPFASSAPSGGPKKIERPSAYNLTRVMNIMGCRPTNAERARLASIEELFKSKLEASGRYKFVQISADTKAKIAGDPEIGHCGGCEIGYGEQLGGDLVAWVVVQKVSNLILNINVPHVCFFFAPGVPSASRSSSSGEILRSRSVRKANAYRGSLAVARFISSIGGRVSCAFKSSIRTFNK
jgi:Protein of unknown function (DUF2380)